MKRVEFKDWLINNTNKGNSSISNDISYVANVEKEEKVDLDSISKNRFQTILDKYNPNSSEVFNIKGSGIKESKASRYYALKNYFDFRFYNNDSYRIVFKKLGISEKKFFDIALETMIFVDPEKVYKETKNIIDGFSVPGNKYAIRKYGKYGSKTSLFIGLYKFLFPTLIFYSEDNVSPKRIFSKCTGLTIGTNSANGNVYNYVLSHIYGKTKNPILYNSPFNYVLCPRMFDPFTGHECSCGWNEHLIKKLRSKVSTKFKKSIVHIQTIFKCNNCISGYILKKCWLC